MLSTDKEDFLDCYKKPLFHEARMGTASENSGHYKPYKYIARDIDEVVEYFKFAENKRRGFSSPYLKTNPYENHFSRFIEETEKKYAHLPESIAHARLYADIEVKYNQALASFK